MLKKKNILKVLMITAFSLGLIACEGETKEKTKTIAEMSENKTITIVKSSLSDSNWDNGISKNKKIILLEDSDIDINKLKEFKTIKFINGSGKKYEILSIEEKGRYIHINLKKEVNEKDIEAKEIELEI